MGSTLDYAAESLKLHYQWKGKIEVTPRAAVDSKDALSLAYTPGVAQPCLEIQKDMNKSYELTRRWNTVAVVTDGTAVLGLGDIGPEAGMPVMEGKCVLFKAFGGVDAIPLCVRSKDVDEIVNTVALLAGSFGGINLEDISAPRCFEIERKLKECCDIPVFHDDQHGTAVVMLAALTNALKVVGKKIEDVKMVTCGAGAAGIAIIRLLMAMGPEGRGSVRPAGRHLRGSGGPEPRQGGDGQGHQSGEAQGHPGGGAKGADVFMGVSAPGLRHAGDGEEHGPRRHPVPHGQPGARDHARPGPWRPAPRWSAPAAATSPTRSTTCWPSRASSGARWTCGPATSTTR